MQTIFGFWNPKSISIRQRIMSEFSLFCNSTIFNIINCFSSLVSGVVQSFTSFVFLLLNIIELTAEKIGCTLCSRQRSPHVQTHLRGNRWVSESFEDCVSMPFEEFERVWQHLEDCFEACFMALQWFCNLTVLSLRDSLEALFASGLGCISACEGQGCCDL